MAAPRVTFAWASAINKVQVNFDQSMQQGAPGNPDDVETLANYAVKAAGGAVHVSPASVSLLVPDPGNSIVELTLDGEMTLGGNYRVEVANVENQTGEVIDPDYDTYGFVGSGGAPQVSSAVALTSQEVEITFNEAMLDEPTLRQPSNYSFSGVTTVVATEVRVMSSTVVRITVTETSRTGATYTVTVNNVRDAARNVIDPLHNFTTFSGKGPKPAVFSPYVTPTNTTVRIVYEAAVVVSEATTPGNYTFDGGVHGVLAITNIAQIDDNTFLATTDAQVAGAQYNVTVAAGTVHDLYGNPIQAGDNTGVFYGAGTGTPEIVFTPGASEEEQTDLYSRVDFDIDATEHPTRQPLRIEITDPESGFTGIDLLSVIIGVVNNDALTLLYSGGAAVGAGYDITLKTTTTDAGLISEAVFRVLPRGGKWQPAGGQFRFICLAADNEGTTNFAFTTFTVETVPTFFEDTHPVATATDEAILTPITTPGLEAIEKIRAILLPRITTSADPVVQARTLLNAGCMVELRALLAGRVAFALVDEIRLADKRPVVQAAALLAPYADTVRSAIQTIPDTSREVRELLLTYQKKSSPVYQLSAAAVSVLMTIFPEN